ncbi:hypothetical protein [Arthrobacter sp. CAN_A1]|uniref:hypothetical protein n=1 Tax=Arthrobacter sp. CAN_A1 TaxID=2787717 RepID=UPI0018C9D229
MTDADPDAPRPISSDWLTLRRPADEAARRASLPLIAKLQAFLAGDSVPDGDLASDRGPARTIRIFDLGAGTGANQAWLAPQLALPQSPLPLVSQHWTLIDHDPDLLEHTASAPAIDSVTGTEAVVAGIEDLGRILGADTLADGLRFVTCSALLDLLTPAQLDTLCAALAETKTAALFSLSVTGIMDIHPADPLDDSLNDTFNTHQNRGGRAGPRGVDLTAGILADAGFTVTTVETPWALTADHAQLIERFLTDRAEAILEENPALADDIGQWLARRSSQAGDGSLRVTIGHQDLLALPPRQ